MKIAREAVFISDDDNPGPDRPVDDFQFELFFFAKHPKIKNSIVNKKVPYTADRPTAVFGSSVLHAPL
jgi:hypothetical protein